MAVPSSLLAVAEYFSLKAGGAARHVAFAPVRRPVYAVPAGTLAVAGDGVGINAAMAQASRFVADIEDRVRSGSRLSTLARRSRTVCTSSSTD